MNSKETAVLTSRRRALKPILAMAAVWINFSRLAFGQAEKAQTIFLGDPVNLFEEFGPFA